MTRVRHAALTGALLLLLASPAVVAAHAELVKATPQDGATVGGGPVDIIGTYSEVIGPKSHMELLDASGDVVARGAIDGKTLRIGLEGLQPGTYQVKWTTVTSDDNGVERGDWSFTVAAASPSPPSAAPSASAAASTSPSAVVTPAPSASRPPGTPTGSSSGDVLLPIVAALVVVALLGGLLLRRRTPTAR